MQHITRRNGGEYATTLMPNGTVETCWFPDDPTEMSRVIGHTFPRPIDAIASEHITAYENKRS